MRTLIRLIRKNLNETREGITEKFKRNFMERILNKKYQYD
jgi:hypothetical protein